MNGSLADGPPMSPPQQQGPFLSLGDCAFDACCGVHVRLINALFSTETNL